MQMKNMILRFKLIFQTPKDILQSPIVFLQRGESKEEGGQGMWTFSGAIDIAKNLSLGVSLNFISGNYKYEREFIETDSQNKYKNFQNNLPNDSLYLRYNRLYIDNLIDTKLEGFNTLLV